MWRTLQRAAAGFSRQSRLVLGGRRQTEVHRCTLKVGHGEGKLSRPLISVVDKQKGY